MKSGLLIVTLCITLITLNSLFVEGRRGGGSRGGGFRASSIRSSRSSSSRGGSRYSGSGYRSAIATGVVVYGMTRYRSRYYGTPHYREDPPICYSNSREYNSTSTNTTTIGGYFICPDGEDVEASFCCGDEDDQNCCGFWEDGGRTAGAIIGIIIGVALLVAAIAFTIFLIYRCKQNSKPPASARYQAHQYDPNNVNNPDFKY